MTGHKIKHKKISEALCEEAYFGISLLMKYSSRWKALWHGLYPYPSFLESKTDYKWPPSLQTHIQIEKKKAETR